MAGPVTRALAISPPDHSPGAIVGHAANVQVAEVASAQVALPNLAPPVTITGISAGLGFACAATSDGTAWCWGGNFSGQLGDGTTIDRHRAVRVTKQTGGNLTGVTTVSAGYGSACARTSDGSAWCWGGNFQGQLGDGTTTDRHRAVRVTKQTGGYLTGVTAISTTGSFGDSPFGHACARTTDGAAWCWGSSNSGELGVGPGPDRHRAMQVTKLGGGYLSGVTAISAGGNSTCARISDGSAWCWGLNYGGSRAERVRKAGGGSLTGVTSVGAGGQSDCASTSDGSAWCWGVNDNGELGNGTTTASSGAVRVTRSSGGNLTGVSTVTVAINVYSCARTTDGSAWCWGVNGSGQLGDGTTIERHRAVRVTAAGGGNLARVSSVSAGAYNTCARTNDGSAWCWGGNDSGQLGDGTTTDRHRAVRVTSV